MKVDAAFLCDAATIREGLLHALGAGVSLLNRPGFPASAGVHLALLIHFDPVQDEGDHEIKVRLLFGEEEIGVVESAFRTAGEQPADADTPLAFLVPVVIDLNPFALIGPGGHRAVVLLDQEEPVTVHFQVLKNQ